MYNDVDWSSRRDGQPFFTQIQLPGGKLRGGTQESAERFAQQIEQTFGARTQTSDVVLPPYYPRDPVLLHDWAAYLDSVRETDRVVGEILDRLKTDGVLGQTVVLVMTDHGISHARGKQFLYEEGIHVPLVIAGPGISPAKTRTDLVEHIDIAALSLGLAGIPQPETMQARDILAENYQPRDAIFSARDRCDETVDHIRCVRTTRFKYIRNFLPQRPHLQPCAYKDSKSILITLRAAHAAGRLNALQQQLLFSPTRPSEELYDLQKDPHELTNLATDPAHQSTLNNLRSRLNNWIDTTADQGREPESTQSYDSDMQVYLDSLRGGKANPKRSREIESNIARMKSWAAAGQ